MIDSEAVNVRIERGLLDSLDAYATSSGETLTRPQAIRTILADWLSTHGFLKRHDHDEPVGPATEAVAAMDSAIEEHKKKRGQS